jgi:hypothetical protein
MKYITVDLRTLKGLKRAEWYHARNWLIVNHTLDSVTFCNPKNAGIGDIEKSEKLRVQL